MTAFTMGEATALALGRLRAPAARAAGTGPEGRATGGRDAAVPGPLAGGFGADRPAGGANWPYGSQRPGAAAFRRRPPARSGAPHPTGAPIRRDSIEAGTFEEHFFTVPAKGEPDRLVRMARAALDAGRRLKRAVRLEGRVLSPAEAALTAMTAGAVRVYEEICMLARLNRGRVFPSYDRLAEATALGRATVARALRALELAGFLVRQRRFKRVASDRSGEGPRYAQTSNAYRPLLPARLLPHLPRWMSPAPLPVDVEQRQAERAEDVAAMHDTLSCRELAQTLVGGSLGRVLAKLGARIDRRQKLKGQEMQAGGTRGDGAGCEYQNQPQPLLDSIYSKEECVGLAGQRTRPDGPKR